MSAFERVITFVKDHPAESTIAIVVVVGGVYLLKNRGSSSASSATPVGVMGTGLDASSYLQLAQINQAGFANQNQTTLAQTQLADQTQLQTTSLADQLTEYQGQLNYQANALGTQNTMLQEQLGAEENINNSNNNVSLSEADMEKQLEQSYLNNQSAAITIQGTAQQTANNFVTSSINANTGRTGAAVASIVGALESPNTAPASAAAMEPYLTTSAQGGFGNVLGQIFSGSGSTIAKGLFGL